MSSPEAFQRIVDIVNDWERRGHALNDLEEIRSIALKQLEQIATENDSPAGCQG